MIASLELLREAQALGAVFTVPEPGRVHIEASEPLPDALMESLRQFKDEVLAHLRRRTELVDLPFPLGYGGLPVEEVARAEAQNDSLGVTDPVERRLNVLLWLWQHYQALADTVMAKEMRGAYEGLRHADPAIKAICGLCEYEP